MSSSIAVNQACTPNIGTVERRKRLAGGVVAILIALAILGILVFTGASRWWRLAPVPVIYRRDIWLLPMAR